MILDWRRRFALDFADCGIEKRMSGSGLNLRGAGTAIASQPSKYTDGIFAPCAQVPFRMDGARCETFNAALGRAFGRVP
jgi:hypothetical protein